MRLMRNYAFFIGPLSLLKQCSPKHKDYMFFFICLSKNDEKHRLVAFYQRVTLLRGGFPTLYYYNDVIMTSRLRCSIFLIAAFNSAHKITSVIENLCRF